MENRRSTRRADSMLVSAGREMWIRLASDHRLQFVSGTLGDLATLVDDHDVVGEQVGLLHVLRGQTARCGLGPPTPR